MYSNDRNAPRMRKGEFSKQIVTKELWRNFIKKFPEHKDITWREFYNSWSEIAETIREEAITNPLGVKLGSYTGELKLQYLPYKMKNAKDQEISNELKEETNHVNLLTRGKVAKIKWERRWAVKFNKMLQFFAFDSTREMNKLAKKHTDENPDKLRMARSVLGGFSFWRQIKKTNGK